MESSMSKYVEGMARKVAVGAVALGAVAAIIASTAVAHASGKGPSVDVWCAAPINAPASSAPQRCSGVSAAFRYIDSHGGLGTLHQNVVVKVCNTNFTPTGEIQCGQSATSDTKAIAMVGPITILSTATFMAGLQAAGMPDINPAVSDPTILTDKISFPLGSENFAPAACAVMAAQAVHAKSVGFALTSNPSAISELNSAVAALPGFNLTNAGNVQFPITAPSLAPYVEQLSQDKPQLTVLTASPQDVGAWLSTAASLGVQTPLCVQDALVDAQTLDGLGGSALNFYTAANYPDPNAPGYPLLAAFRKQAAAEVAAGDTTASTGPANNGTEVLSGVAWCAGRHSGRGEGKGRGHTRQAPGGAQPPHGDLRHGQGRGTAADQLRKAKPGSCNRPRVQHQGVLEGVGPGDAQVLHREQGSSRHRRQDRPVVIERSGARRRSGTPAPPTSATKLHPRPLPTELSDRWAQKRGSRRPTR